MALKFRDKVRGRRFDSDHRLMSRLQKHQKKQLIKSTLLYLFILFAIIYFISTIGLKLLLNTAVFFGNLGSTPKNVSPTSTNSDFIGNISIDSIPTATNSAKFVIGGSFTNFDQLEFYINGERVNKITVSASNEFSEEIGDLKKGLNEIYVLAKSKKEKKEKKSKIFTIFYKSDKPKLEISEPTDKSKVNKQEIKIVGLTDKETFITVNSLPLVVDSQGNFQTTIRLKEGENKIEIIAQDIAGNQEQKNLTLTYQKED